MAVPGTTGGRPRIGEPTAAADRQAAPYPGCAKIFDGKSFEGWEADPSTWSIADGAMRGVGGSSRLAYTKADYGSFRLIFTARMNPVNGDHLGVLFWGDRPKDPSKPKIDNAGWIQFMPPHGAMWDYHPPKHQNLPHETLAKGSRDFTRWCTTELLCNLEKGTMRAAVDGVEIARYTHPDRRRTQGPREADHSRPHRHVPPRLGRLRIQGNLPGGRSERGQTADRAMMTRGERPRDRKRRSEGTSTGLGAPRSRRIGTLGQTTEAGDLLDRLRAGDDSARDRLIALAQGRFVALARAMLRRYPHVRRWEETDDLLQAALMRLHRGLAVVRPEDVPHFDNLAATQIRRELIDLARSYHGPEGLGANHHTDGTDPGGRLAQVAEASGQPESLEEWTAFHEAVDRLPEEERQVMDLLWYRGLTHAQAAESLGVATKTIQRRWASARLMIRDALEGEQPRGD